MRQSWYKISSVLFVFLIYSPSIKCAEDGYERTGGHLSATLKGKESCFSLLTGLKLLGVAILSGFLPEVSSTFPPAHTKVLKSPISKWSEEIKYDCRKITKTATLHEKKDLMSTEDDCYTQRMFKLLETAVSHGGEGSAVAAYELAYLHEGIVEFNSTEAVRLYDFSARAGFPDAQYYMGELYTCGFMVPQNFTLAKEYWNNASAQGHPGATIRLEAYLP